MNDQQEKRVNLLLNEYKILWDEIKERIGRSDKIMAVGLTVLGAGLVYGIKEGIAELLLVLPLGLYAVMFYAVFNSTVVLTLGGHRKYLAERLNRYFGEELLTWEKVAHETIHRNIAQVCLQLLYALSLIAAIAVGYNASTKYSATVKIIYIVVVALLSALMAISLIILARAFDKSYKISKNYGG